jgi:hypothetical protein
MSGYLGRMVQAAVRSERRLHPMAGSLFGERDSAQLSLGLDLGEPHRTVEDQAPAENERMLPPRGLGAPVTISPARQPMAFFDQYEPLQPPRRRPDTSRAAELSSPVRADRAASHEHDPGRAMTTSRERLDATPRMHDRSDADVDAAHVSRGANLREPLTKAIAVRADGATGERSATSARDRDATQAQIERIPRNAGPTFSAELQARSATRGENSPRHEATRQTRTNEPQAEVHIGRIEVLALQPPAPPRASRRERTTSLADYLAGRNGHGR